MKKRLVLTNHLNQKVEVWLYIDQIITYNKKRELTTLEEYVIYYKFAEPTPILLGELLRDKNKKVRVFKSIKEAIDACVKHLKDIWDLQ